MKQQTKSAGFFQPIYQVSAHEQASLCVSSAMQAGLRHKQQSQSQHARCYIHF